ncbi:unnamed protein product [Mytilus coruscus]|uniref:Uncharacterized protein n=1 Tax=Mytilus coruscus TaxID=42192 RepID=A0A6J8EW97_MYTCO|nr:unnamed protein product [Mytilus coruscus]
MLRGVEIANRDFECSMMFSDITVVSVIKLPSYICDDEITSKIESKGVKVVSPVYRRTVPGTQVADGTRFMRFPCVCKCHQCRSDPCVCPCTDCSKYPCVCQCTECDQPLKDCICMVANDNDSEVILQRRPDENHPDDEDTETVVKFIEVKMYMTMKV